MQRVHGLSAEEARRITAKEDTPVDPEVAAAAAEQIKKAKRVVGAEEMARRREIHKRLVKKIAEGAAGMVGRVACRERTGRVTSGTVEEMSTESAERAGAGEELVAGVAAQPKPGIGQTVASGEGVSTTEATVAEFGAEGLETTMKFEIEDVKSFHQL